MRTLVLVPVVAGAVFAATPALAACKHPYFPVKEGAVRNYKSDDGNETDIKVTKVEGNKVSFDLHLVPREGSTIKEKTLSLDGECSDEGFRMDMNTVAYDSANPAAGDFTIKVTKNEGMTVPEASKLKAGATWTSTQVHEASSSRMPWKIVTESTTQWKYGGPEKVTTPAGTFDTIRIDGDTTVTTHNEGAMMAPNANAHPPSHRTQTMWIARGVGMVKTDVKIEFPRGGEKIIHNELIKYSN